MHSSSAASKLKRQEREGEAHGGREREEKLIPAVSGCTSCDASSKFANSLRQIFDPINLQAACHNCSTTAFEEREMCVCVRVYKGLQYSLRNCFFATIRMSSERHIFTTVDEVK